MRFCAFHLRSLALVLSLATIGYASANIIDGGAVARAPYEASAAKGAGALAGRARAEGTTKPASSFILAPVILTYEFQDTAYIGSYSSVEAWWVNKQNSGDFRLVANEIYHTVLGSFRDKYKLTMSKDAFKARPELDKYGQLPYPNLGRGYIVSAFDYKDYDRTRTREILEANPGNDAVLYIQVRSRLVPRSLNVVEDVPSMNYAVYNQVRFYMCDSSNNCAAVKSHQMNADRNDAADQMIPIPRADAKANPKFKDANEFGRKLIAQSIPQALQARWGDLNSK